MEPPVLPGILQNCCDAALCADIQGTILWKNPAAIQLLQSKAASSKLSELFSLEIATQILDCEQFETIELPPQSSFHQKLRLSALVTCLGTGDPDDEKFLIILKPFNGVGKQLHQREDAIATVTHDLKNPLGAIFGYADALLTTTVGAGMNEKQNEIVARLRSTAARSLELVRNFQHLSQLNSGESSFNYTPCNLNAAIETVIKSVWREDEKRPALSLALEKNLPQINADRLQLDRVITNLYTNALKFCPLEGSINLETRSDNYYVYFSINNKLPLVPENELSKIFQRRYRASNSRNTAGSGLGLYIVKTIVDRMGASISAESNPTSGTTFTIKAPRI